MNANHRPIIAPAGKTIPARYATLRRSALAAALAAVGLATPMGAYAFNIYLEDTTRVTGSGTWLSARTTVTDVSTSCPTVQKAAQYVNDQFLGMASGGQFTNGGATTGSAQLTYWRDVANGSLSVPGNDIANATAPRTYTARLFPLATDSEASPFSAMCDSDSVTVLDTALTLAASGSFGHIANDHFSISSSAAGTMRWLIVEKGSDWVWSPDSAAKFAFPYPKVLSDAAQGSDATANAITCQSFGVLLCFPSGTLTIVARGSAALSVGANSIGFDTSTLDTTKTYVLYAMVDDSATGNYGRTYYQELTYAAAGPALTSSIPADDASGVLPGATIALTFDEWMGTDIGDLKIVNDTDSTTETISVSSPGGKFAWSVDHKTLTITPGTPLAAGKSYHLEIVAHAFIGNTNELPYAGITNATTLNFSVAGAPAAPTGATATAGDAQLSVAFTPGADGGSAITGYAVSCTSSDGGVAGSNTGTASPIVVTSLTNGKSYTCIVTATNSVGAGSASTASTAASPAPTSIAVISIADSGAGSLRQALSDIAAGGTITFDPSVAEATIGLVSTLTLSKSVTIDGGSQKVAIDGDGAVRVLTISDGVTVTLQKLTIANGNDSTSGGGGIRNGNATLTLDQITFSGNTSSGAGGGGLYNAGGLVTIGNSTFSANSGVDGGGLRNSGGTLNLTNVTFSGNSASAGGGAIFAGGGTVTINNVTIANNSATSGSGGIENQGATINLKNTLLAANTGSNCSNAAPITNIGYNLDDGASCGFGSSNHSQSSADPLLGVLSDNGGYTQTLSLGAGSPAINVGNNATCAATDQRGASRALSVADACDIGALELVAASVLSGGSVTPSAGGASVSVTLSTPATLYWLLAPAGSFKPADGNEIKNAVTGTTYACDEPSPAASGNGFAAGLCSAGVLTRGQVVVATAGGAASITLSGLTASTSYILYGVAQDAYGTFSVVGNANFTTTAASSAPTGGNNYTAPAPSNPTLPSGGGTVAPTGGQIVTVTDNGKEGSSISLPSQTTATGIDGVTTTTANTIKVDLPGTGTVSASSTSQDTKLGVTNVTLPGSTTSVSAVTVDQGSASFTATKSGQAMAGLKNGIVVVSGTKDSQVTVDTTGATPKIGVKSADTLIVPSGAPNVSGTRVDLPPPTATGGAASTVNLNIGGQELTIQSSQSNTTMTFQVVNIGGVQTPVLAITGNAQITTSGEDKPIATVAGNVIKTGKSSGSGGGQACNTTVQASSDASSDAVHVVTCYIVLETGSFSGLKGRGTGNNFAAIQDGIVWAGETAEFDKNGVVTSAYLGSRLGDTDAVGDDVAPGGNKFTAHGYHLNAFIPRLAGTPLRLNGAKLDERIFAVVNQALNVTTQPALPLQSDQGVLNFTFTGNLNGQGVQNQQVNYTIDANTASILPSRRIRIDTSRADGVSISAEGEVDVATGGLITTFVPSVADPKAFAEQVNQALPGATSTLRWNGTWQVSAADGTRYVGRPQWSFWPAAPDAATFSATVEGNVLFSNNGRAQPLFPDFYDYDTLQATFRTELNDPALTVLPRMDGTATATVNGQAYTLAPQWNLIKPAAGKPAWWVEGGVVYIKNADGSAQGFTVK